MEKRAAKKQALKAKVRQRAHRRDYDNQRPRRSNWMDRHEDRYEEHCTSLNIDVNLGGGGGGGRRRRNRHHYHSDSSSSSCSNSDEERGGAFAEGGLVIINNPASTETVGNTENFAEEVTEGMYEE